MTLAIRHRFVAALLAAALLGLSGTAIAGDGGASPDGADYPGALIHRHPLLPSLPVEMRAEAPPKEFPARDVDAALLQYFTLLIYENVHYWAVNSFVEDWQYEMSWDDQKRRFFGTDALRFDSNAFSTNWTHSYAGGIYYTAGRANGMTPLESFWLVLGESLYWEYVVEWREVVSVNDTVSTIFGGLSIGEPWYQLAAYLNSRNQRVARALGFIHPVMGVQTLMGKRWPGALSGEGMPGYGVWLVAGARSTASPVDSVDGGSYAIGLRSRLADRAAFLGPGNDRTTVTDTLSSELSFAFAIDGGKVKETDFFSRAVLLGRVDREMDGAGYGRAVSLGLGTAFTLRKVAAVAFYDGLGVPAGRKEDLLLAQPRDFRDKYALVHLAGPVVEGVLRGRRGAVSFLAEAYPDFGLVNAYALNDYSADHDISGIKTTMLYYGYYYGWGGSLRARVDAASGPFAAGLSGELHRHASIEGLDRYEDDLAGDVHASDTWDKLRASFGVAIPRAPLRLEGSGEWTHRKGRIGETVTQGSESRYALQMLLSL
jgi:hypothetical protein